MLFPLPSNSLELSARPYVVPRALLPVHYISSFDPITPLLLLPLTCKSLDTHFAIMSSIKIDTPAGAYDQPTGL